ncbi:MAG: histidine triad (HIT) family protein [Planctomycetota bacterium]|jgi:histidine triad (HIT) family protein
MPTIFSKIVAGELPCHRIWEDEKHLAFLDIRPTQKGHTLVIPKREVAYLFDLEPDEHADLWRAVQTVSKQLKERLGCERVVVLVIGWEVPHVHVHLIPTNAMHQVSMPPPCEVSEEEMLGLVKTLSF